MKYVTKLQLALVMIIMLVTFVRLVPRVSAATSVSTGPEVTDETCQADRSKKFLGIFPVWYEYISDYKKVPVTSQFGVASCGIVHTDGSDAGNNVKKDAIAIALAVLDILLRVGALVGVLFIIAGGYKYISSQVEPKNIEAAMATIVNAVIGLVIVILAAALVAFVGHTLRG